MVGVCEVGQKMSLLCCLLASEDPQLFVRTSQTAQQLRISTSKQHRSLENCHTLCFVEKHFGPVLCDCWVACR